MTNNSEKKANLVGRPSVFKNNELQEKYVNIWCAHFFLKLPIWELTKKYECSKHTVKNAITFVNREFVKIPNEYLIQGARFAITERIKRLTSQLEQELRKKPPATRSVVELNREIREDSRDLMKIENIYQEKYSVEIEGGESIREILREINKNKK